METASRSSGRHVLPVQQSSRSDWKRGSSQATEVYRLLPAERSRAGGWRPKLEFLCRRELGTLRKGLVQCTMAFEPFPRKDWYSVLGAEPSASMKNLKQKYQKLILMYHPDKQSTDVPAGAVEERVQRFIEIGQAWKILGNEETRKAYDLQRREDELRTVGPVDAQVDLEDMLWNKEDQCFTLSCRCGGKYCVSKDEAEEFNLICCDTCSLIIEIVQHS
ncbi:dnaJ homolog subfamily C member 24 [Notamacropus eugenii]|uniref:dnaJ homolog subfamily C member 24 n=1 Tax=Notamacropus eugenii TaxID=9315 RepID=UPI003B67EE98